MSNNTLVAIDADVADSPADNVPADNVPADEDAAFLHEGRKGKRLNWSHIKDALETQSRVIHALILRETMSRYGVQKIGFLWALLEPVLMVTLIVGFMSMARTDSPSGMPLVPFMITGFIPFFMFRNTMNQLKSAISSSRSLLGYPQVTTFDVIIARVLLEAGVMLLVFAVVLTMAHLLGYQFRIENPLGVLVVCLALMALGSGLGFVLAAVIPIIPSVGQVTGLVLGRPLFMASGLFFTASSVPDPYRTWLLYNPIFHLLELLRSYFFYEFESAYANWTYAGSWVAGTLAFGMLTHQALRRRAIVGL